ncbi:MAG: hypothetical protein ACLFPE_07885 [Bacteroidales bacterium]
MNNQHISEEIGKLIGKIQKDWDRAEVSGRKISRIDRDILITRIRQLYDLISDLESVTANQPGREAQQHEPQESGAFAFPEDKPESDSDKPAKTPDEKPHADSGQLYDNKKKPKPEQPQELPQKNGSNQPLNSKLDPPSKAAVDLFTPSKTLLDVYKTNHDNSVAAKIKQHRIEDIRSAIGLNDKFLMINHIFDGEMSKYNQSIDKLNSFDHFHDALQYIDELRLKAKGEESQTAMNKLLEIVKRKFH